MKEVNVSGERPPPQRVPVPSGGGPPSIFEVGSLKKRSIILNSIYLPIYPSIYRPKVQQGGGGSSRQRQRQRASTAPALRPW